MVNVLLIGQGGREHALALKLSQSRYLSNLAIWPSNPAMKGLGHLWTHLPSDLGTPDFGPLIDEIQRSKIDLVVVGPETPLSMGLADALNAKGIRVFGPSQEAAQLETDKAFAKALMAQAGIPTAWFQVSHGEEQTKILANQMLMEKGGVVIKASGLAAGKGVFVCRDKASIDQALQFLFHTEMKSAAKTVVLEEILVGKECSFFVFLGHDKLFEIGFAVDYKRLLNHHEGPNTGGMGCYTPVPWLPSEAGQTVMDRIVRPLLDTLKQRNISYTGCLYVGLMWSPEKGPQVVEFNVRLGDPEAQVLSYHDPRDWLELMAQAAGFPAMNSHSPSEKPLQKTHQLGHATVGVVLTTPSYPYGRDRGNPGILPLEVFSKDQPRTQIFGASLMVHPPSPDTHTQSGTGRVLTVIGSGRDFDEAREKAYQEVTKIKSYWKECYFRSDIALEVSTGLKN